MNFKLHRDRVIASTCGLSIRFEKDVFRQVPPAMYAEVIAAGGVSEDELPDDEKPAALTAPESAAAREAAIFKAYETVVLKNRPTDFTAGGAPHITVVSAITGWPVLAKERDTTWMKFKQGEVA